MAATSLFFSISPNCSGVIPELSRGLAPRSLPEASVVGSISACCSGVRVIGSIFLLYHRRGNSAPRQDSREGFWAKQGILQLQRTLGNGRAPRRFAFLCISHIQSPKIRGKSLQSF